MWWRVIYKIKTLYCRKLVSHTLLLIGVVLLIGRLFCCCVLLLTSNNAVIRALLSANRLRNACGSARGRNSPHGNCPPCCVRRCGNLAALVEVLAACRFFHAARRASNALVSMEGGPDNANRYSTLERMCASTLPLAGGLAMAPGLPPMLWGAGAAASAAAVDGAASAARLAAAHERQRRCVE